MFTANIPSSTHTHADENLITSTFTAWNQSPVPHAQQWPTETTTDLPSCAEG